MNQRSSIEINGNIYDVVTGELLSSKVVAAEVSSAPSVAQAIKPADVAKARTVARHAHSHQQQTSQTLMRRAVHKPAKVVKDDRLQAASSSLQPKVSAFLTPKSSVRNINSRRLEHAQQVSQSTAIKRFPTPVMHRPTPINPVSYRPPALSPSPTPAKAAAPPSKLPHHEDLWLRAIDLATNYEEPKPKRRSKRAMLLARRKTSVAALAVSVVVLAVIVGYSQQANLRMHAAASKASFAVSVPGYQPSGFSLNTTHASSNQVAFLFHSDSDSRQYSVTETNSNWDDQSLVNNFVATFGPNYQSIQNAGKTLYVYGKNNAAWVSAGVWYQIQTDGALGTHQLLQLASSL